MILQQLYEDSDAILHFFGTKLPPMYDWSVVKWQVDLTLTGKFQALIPLGDKGTRHPVPYNYGRSVDIVPNLLVDTADYALGILDKNAARKNAAFLALVRDCAEKTNESCVLAVVRFLEAGGIPTGRVLPDLKVKDRVMFVVDGKEPSTLPSVQGYWSECTTHKYKDNLKRKGRCLITGKDGYLETILPGDISINGENAAIISVNEKAGCSHGFEQSLNGAVSRDAAEGFTKALNALMRGEKTHLSITSGTPPSLEVMYVFWTKRGPNEEVPDGEVYDFVNDPEKNPDHVYNLLSSPIVTSNRLSNKSAEELPEFFHALAISGNKTRVVFRDWLSLPRWQVTENLRRWFMAQRIVGEDGGKGSFNSVYRFAASIYRDPKKELRGPAATALFRAALNGDPIPRRLLAQAVMQCRTANKVTPIRAALMKAALTTAESDPILQEKIAKKMEHLDPDNVEAAYLCGRLLALLESIQYTAQGSLNSTIIDRFFSAAAATPRRVLTMLVQKAERAHLPKIRRQGVGLYLVLKDELGALIGALPPGDPFPAQFGLEDQARYLLGYYHQRAAIRKNQIKRLAERKAKADAEARSFTTSTDATNQGEN